MVFFVGKVFSCDDTRPLSKILHLFWVKKKEKEELV